VNVFPKDKFSKSTSLIFEEFAIRLGNLTEEVGHTLHLQLDAIKDRDAHIKALEHELSQ
jgi:hypothetical protein